MAYCLVEENSFGKNNVKKVPILIALCSVLVSFSCSQQGKTLPQNLGSVEKFTSPILEVTTICRGEVYPKKGEILHMRLFDNGRFEYDDFPDYDPPRFSSRNVSITRKEGTLNKEGVEKLVSLAESKDFLLAKDRYEGIQAHTDTEWTTKVEYRHGEIQKIGCGG